MRYRLFVIDGDGHSHHADCANLSDVTSWMYKFMADGFVDGNATVMKFEIKTTNLKEHNENG